MRGRSGDAHADARKPLRNPVAPRFIVWRLPDDGGLLLQVQFHRLYVLLVFFC